MIEWKGESVFDVTSAGYKLMRSGGAGVGRFTRAGGGTGMPGLGPELRELTDLALTTRT